MNFSKGIYVFFALLLTLAAGFTYGSITDARAQKKVDSSCTDSYKLIAVMEDGDVKVYRVTSCIFYEGTDILARRDTCYVTVGELHGKTVATECIS